MRRNQLIRPALALLAVPAILASAGCTPQAGSAATVGGRRISVAEVQDAYRDAKPLFGQDSRLAQGDVLAALIAEPYLVAATARLGRGISQHDAELQFQQVSKEVPHPSDAAVTAVRAFMAATQLQSDDRSPADIRATFTGIGALLQRRGVQVNPRYGSSFDYRTFTITPELPNWLPKPTVAAPQGGSGAP